MTSDHHIPGEERRRWARSHFEWRSRGYQGGFAQRVYCRPTSRFLLRQAHDQRPQTQPFRVLDIGCGTGQLLADLRDRCSSAALHGLDLCEGMLRSARRLLGPDATLVQGDSRTLPFDDGQFDLVTCTHCFHHFPNQLAAVREMLRVLCPAGRAMILDGDRDTAWGWLLYDVLVSRAEGGVNHRSAIDMQALLKEAGFSQVEIARAHPLSPVLLTVGVRHG